ncbi:50S ribosomal protein L4 [Tuwongella immobilis]|uniref:Large ribosomal subunit protein uL4 n=1 Tax=Tuwongella immobilis TaxID=692036 RepID=A0A6C2YNA3_9BACT|nr:50S ribosomal protein L4 [Tuwongella immobilis]VIP02689.1 50s ribosomal protein l4 : 50S ribosomal protein L4 OS=Rhodopirellula maiorica SM1 GN=rplD PE=3 SV=1: Ribosomal_L4 [Tuwongella immobilis]VTS02156.1 50s ribosomal protein l4 : 50S ribosomal protein L4 OS=Rhodopirellula maiorica SM1 GN=rplD PE=3 SV=1: Ribosomal_L4 [Tuwongella immobilis]
MAESRIIEVTEKLQLPVYNRQGESVGTIDIDPADFGGKISKQLLHEVVLMYLANQRSGTHSTLRRGEVAGSTKKLFRQKGTGNARAGTKRTNKRRGGGTAKGPKPRDYEYHLPRKAVRAATRMAILSKIKDQQAVVIDDFGLTAPKTKEMAGILKALKVEKTCLISDAALNEPVYKSGRNIPGVKVLPAAELNTYLVLKQKQLVLTRAALELLVSKGKSVAAAS